MFLNLKWPRVTCPYRGRLERVVLDISVSLVTSRDPGRGQVTELYVTKCREHGADVLIGQVLDTEQRMSGYIVKLDDSVPCE